MVDDEMEKSMEVDDANAANTGVLRNGQAKTGLSFFLSFILTVSPLCLLTCHTHTHMCVCRFFNGFSQYTR